MCQTALQLVDLLRELQDLSRQLEQLDVLLHLELVLLAAVLNELPLRYTR